MTSNISKMEDNLKYLWECKTNSIFLKIEDNIDFLKMEDNLNFFENRRQLKTFLKMEDDLNIF